MATEKIWIASDHAGFELKEKIKKNLKQYQWADLGPHSTESMDYPDTAAELAQKVSEDFESRGILMCGSGVGMCIVANKFPGVRAALIHTEDMAKATREHNDSNVLCLGARVLDAELAVRIVKTWLETPFSEDERHIRRLEKIKVLEKAQRK